MRFTFEDTVFDTALRELRRAGEAVAIEPQVFDVLSFLIEHRDRMVPKTELLDTVWGDRFVSESALTSRIKSARQAIGDSGREQRLIRTVHGRGFRFIGAVVEAERTGGDSATRGTADSDRPIETADGAGEVRTVLFSDIESSTRLWERFGDEMHRALAAHDQIVNQQVGAHGGRIFKHTGDGFIAEFEHSEHAASAAVAIQEVLQQRDWAPLPGLRVRMALHRGEVSERGGDLFGIAVNAAGKLLGVVNGGQIVASNVVADDLRSTAANGMVRAAGAFEVLGLGDHEFLHLVASEAMDIDDRPLRADTGARTNLPRRRTDVVGRNDEISRVADALDGSDLVSIVGPGGAGKTTLAVEVGRRSLPDFAGGVWLCELAAIEHGHVPSAVLGAIEGNAGTSVSVDQIVDRLGPGRVLLVIDNCEHVIDDVAKLVDELLEMHDSLTVLATSREQLDVRGETVARIDGLRHDAAGDEGVELFLRRAREVAPVGDGAAERETARAIVERLDGLPLAIELAAPRLASASLDELHDHLDDQLSVLSSRRRHVDRQSTMARAIGWSFDLLTDNERSLLRDLSVFSCPFQLGAVESVSAAISPNESIHRLVEQSMVVRLADDQGSRFRVLEPIRQFVDRDLDDAERVALHERHAEYFGTRVSNLAAQMRTPDEPAAASSLTAEWPDFAKAVGWALANGRADVVIPPLVALECHLLYQLRAEAFGWLEQAVATFGDLGEQRAAVDVLRGYGAWIAGDLARARDLHDAAMEDNDPTPASIFLAFCNAMAAEDFGEVLELGNRMWQVATDAGDAPWTIASSAYRTVGQAMADPESPTLADRVAVVDQHLDESDWPTGRCASLLAMHTRCMRTGAFEEMDGIRSELQRVSAECGAPWFMLTAGSQAGAVSSGAEAIRQLISSAQSLRNAVSSDDQSQLPAVLRSTVIGLAGVGEFELAAPVVGLIPSVRGIGESGSMTPGYDEAAELVREGLGESFGALEATGSQVDLGALADRVDAIASRLSNGMPD